MNAKDIVKLLAPFLIGAGIATGLIFLFVVGSLRSSNAKLAADKVRLEQSVKATDAALAASKSELESARTALADAREANSRLKRELDGAQQRVSELAGQLERAKGLIDKLTEGGAGLANGAADALRLAQQAQDAVLHAIRLVSGSQN